MSIFSIVRTASHTLETLRLDREMDLNNLIGEPTDSPLDFPVLRSLSSRSWIGDRIIGVVNSAPLLSDLRIHGGERGVALQVGICDQRDGATGS
jgi:hypothetical protein